MNSELVLYKSKDETEFRIWATNVLRQHIVQGYTVNEKSAKPEEFRTNRNCSISVDSDTNLRRRVYKTPIFEHIMTNMYTNSPKIEQEARP
ncbi:MAG: hypothetical protein JXR40_13255 [Pontiellaceae bacterium]|nr:hypothetical protein [Pontiellaceae bacterium]